jgi:hypothetical protein
VIDLESIGAVIGAAAAAAVTVRAGWKKISPVLDRLVEFLSEWAGDEDTRSIPERLKSLEKSNRDILDLLKRSFGAGCERLDPPGAPACRDKDEDPKGS